MARRRLECLKKKMAQNPELAKNLNNQLRDHIGKGNIRKLNERELQQKEHRVWYLPMFPVVNPNKPGKIRMVWDAAAKVNDVRLNSVLLKGPDMLVSLPAMLYGFREKRFGLCADIKEMFRQIMIRESDQHAQRFLWPSDGPDPDIYISLRMTFGACCSPFCAQYVKNKNALEYAEQFPKAAKAIIDKHYVDDYIDSFDTEDEAIQVASEVKFVQRKGGFEIVNWESNSTKVGIALNDTEVSSKKDLNMGSEDGAEKVLGMWWCTTSDQFRYQLTKNPKNTEILLCGRRPTKREVLRTIMMIFDPLGLLSHYLVYVKVLLQDVWRAQLDWDDKLEGELFDKWTTWVKM